MSADGRVEAEQLARARARVDLAANRAAAMLGPGDPVVAVPLARWFAARYFDRVESGEIDARAEDVDVYVAATVEDLEGPWAQWVMAREREFTAVGAADGLGRTGRDVCPGVAEEDEAVMAAIDARTITPAGVALQSERQSLELERTIRRLMGVRAGMAEKRAESVDPDTKLGVAIGAGCRAAVQRIRAAVDSVQLGSGSAAVVERLRSEAGTTSAEIELLAQTPEEWPWSNERTANEMMNRAETFEQRCRGVQIPTGCRPVGAGPELVR